MNNLSVKNKPLVLFALLIAVISFAVPSTSYAQENAVGAFMEVMDNSSESGNDNQNQQTKTRNQDQKQNVKSFKADRRVPLYMPIHPQDNSDTLSYDGYSEDFYPIRELYRQGRGDTIHWAYKKADKILKKEAGDDQNFARGLGKLGLMERGTIYLLSNDRKRAIDRLSRAEKVINKDEEESGVVSGFMDTITTTLGGLTGQGELGEYEPAGFEKVLMLNYESIAYLLNGDRGAYNIARRSINWQDQEHEKFRKEIKKSKKNLEKQEKKAEKNSEDEGTAQAFSGISNTLDAIYGQHEDIATDVPNAFVNPFGHYVQGMINEYDAYKTNFRDRSLLDNAKISYQKGLELNPDAKVLQKAVEDLKDGNPPPKNTRLIHIVGGHGFAPVKKELTYVFSYGGTRVPIRLPKYEPLPSPVDEITVETIGGRDLTELSTVSNVEALVLRYQQDRAPERAYKALTAVTSNYFQNQALGEAGLVGNIAKGIMDEMKNADTRSWLSLPKYMMAGRIHLDKDISKIKIVSRNERGRVLASEVVDINDEYSDFVYTRAIRDHLHAMNSEKLWMNYY